VNYRYLVAMVIVMGCDAEDHPWPATTLTIEPRAPAPVTGVGPLDLQVLCLSPDPIKIVVSTTHDFKHNLLNTRAKILEHEEQ